jgi:hypothetical protein
VEARAGHWDGVYSSSRVQGASWYQETPAVSLELLDALDVGRDVAVVDVGGGASTLVDHLLARGFTDLSVLDVSADAIAEARRRVGHDVAVDWLHEDVLVWRPRRRFGLWHDRALFHFLIDSGDRDAYVRTLRSALEDGGFVVLATFASDGPPTCSGLPVVRYSVEQLVEALGVGFEPVQTRREEHVTPRGAVQPFTWVAGRMQLPKTTA